MLGTIVNACAILAGSCIGALARRGVSEKYRDTLFTAMGLATLTLGVNVAVQGMDKSEYPVLFIACLAIGGILGTSLRLDERVRKYQDNHNKGDLVGGIVTSSLLFCAGTLSMVGPVMSALYSDNTYLFTNATLDLVTAAIFASTYGFCIAWSALILTIWQGAIYIITLMLGDYVSESLIIEVSIVGGVLIIASSLDILRIRDCRPLNLLPALLIPPVFFLLRHWYIYLLS